MLAQNATENIYIISFSRELFDLSSAEEQYILPMGLPMKEYCRSSCRQVSILRELICPRNEYSALSLMIAFIALLFFRPTWSTQPQHRHCFV